MKFRYRQARKADLKSLIEMLADDKLGSSREDASLPIKQQYLDAFAEIDSDPNNELIVLESGDSLSPKIIGTLQLTFIPYLTYQGSRRCLIEGVRIHKDYRGNGLGTEMFKWGIHRAKRKGCFMVQLTSNKAREDAIRFYEALGFEASHEGFKLIF